MTGYGRAAVALGTKTLTVQISTVNRRTLDITMGLPSAWQGLEPAILDAVRAVLRRGKVHLAFELTGGGGVADWDARALGETLDRLAELARERAVPFSPDAMLIWQIASAQKTGRDVPAVEEAEEPVLQAVQEALRELVAMRAREGEALLVDFLGRLEKLHHQVEAVALRAPQTVMAYREQLMQRLRGSGLELDLNDERVLKEVALFADRCDITEELTRLRSHLAQLRELLRSDGEAGRKGEFLLQEVGREIHTIGSKANDLAISRAVIEFKNELERVREQMANVE